MIQYELVPNISQRLSIGLNNVTYLFRFKMGKEFIYCDCSVDDVELFAGKLLTINVILAQFFVVIDTDPLQQDPVPDGFGTRWLLISISQ